MTYPSEPNDDYDGDGGDDKHNNTLLNKGPYQSRS